MKNLYSYMNRSEYLYARENAYFENWLNHIDNEYDIAVMEHEMRLKDIETQAFINNYSADILKGLYIKENTVFTEGIGDIFDKFFKWVKGIINAILGKTDDIKAAANETEEPADGLEIPVDLEGATNACGDIFDFLKGLLNFKITNPDGSESWNTKKITIAGSAVTVTGIAAALVAFVKPVRVKLQDLIAMLPKVSDVIEKIRDFVSDLESKIKTEGEGEEAEKKKGLWNGIKNAAAGTLNWISGGLTKVLGKMKKKEEEKAAKKEEKDGDDSAVKKYTVDNEGKGYPSEDDIKAAVEKAESDEGKRPDAIKSVNSELDKIKNVFKDGVKITPDLETSLNSVNEALKKYGIALELKGEKSSEPPTDEEKTKDNDGDEGSKNDETQQETPKDAEQPKNDSAADGNPKNEEGSNSKETKNGGANNDGNNEANETTSATNKITITKNTNSRKQTEIKAIIKNYLKKEKKKTEDEIKTFFKDKDVTAAITRFAGCMKTEIDSDKWKTALNTLNGSDAAKSFGVTFEASLFDNSDDIDTLMGYFSEGVSDSSAMSLDDYMQSFMESATGEVDSSISDIASLL